MSGLANHHSDVSVEVLEAAFNAALSAPDPDEGRVEAVRAKMTCWRPDPSMVAESMLLWAAAMTAH